MRLGGPDRSAPLGVVHVFNLPVPRHPLRVHRTADGTAGYPPNHYSRPHFTPFRGRFRCASATPGTGSWRALVSRGTRVASRSRRPRPRRSREFHICRGDAPIQRRSDLGRARWRCGAKVGQSGAASFVPGQIRKNRDRPGPSTLRCERGETIAERNSRCNRQKLRRDPLRERLVPSPSAPGALRPR